MIIKNDLFAKAVRFIYKNIDQPLTLADIAKVAGVSLSSLKRLFYEAVALSPGVFIRQLRMELAFRSLKSRENSVLEVALAAGFSDQSAFARQFKQTFGYSPNQACQKLNIVSELSHIELESPTLVELIDFELQVITLKGLYYESASKAWQKLSAKLTHDELSDDFAGLFVGIGHDNPHEGEVAPDQVRYSAGIAHLNRNLGISRLLLSGGHYAQFHFHGKPNHLGLAYHYIYGTWQEKSSCKIDQEKPAFTTFTEMPQPNQDYHINIWVPLTST